ncbi:MAG: hypothetical protein DHS20C12_12020 [Pseudohongiella sp.]|nr:MAG: hypothetical protein DHS20C12_12020 [Pseudohongiella sp.]
MAAPTFTTISFAASDDPYDNGLGYQEKLDTLSGNFTTLSTWVVTESGEINTDRVAAEAARDQAAVNAAEAAASAVIAADPSANVPPIHAKRDLATKHPSISYPGEWRKTIHNTFSKASVPSGTHLSGTYADAAAARLAGGVDGNTFESTNGSLHELTGGNSSTPRYQLSNVIPARMGVARVSDTGFVLYDMTAATTKPIAHFLVGGSGEIVDIALHDNLIAFATATDGVTVYDLARMKAWLFKSSGLFVKELVISDTAMDLDVALQVNSTSALASADARSVSFHVPKSAPIDPLTHTAIPTLLSALAAGFAIIRPDKSVTDWMNGSGSMYNFFALDDELGFWGAGGAGSAYKLWYIRELPTSDSTSTDFIFHDGGLPKRPGDNNSTGQAYMLDAGNGTALVDYWASDGIRASLIKINPATPARSLVAHISDTSNTGYFKDHSTTAVIGCSTKTGAMSDANNVSLTFDSDVEGFVAVGGATVTQSAGALEVTSNGANTGAARAVTAVIGDYYKVSTACNQDSGANSNYLRIGTTAGGSEIASLEGANFQGGSTNGVLSTGFIVFKATAETIYISQIPSQSAGRKVTCDNVEYSLLDYDFSENGNHLEIAGTGLSRASIDGAYSFAEKSGYSGTSFQFSTNTNDNVNGVDFELVIGAKTSATTDQTLVSTGEPGATTERFWWMRSNGNVGFHNGTLADDTTGLGAFNDGLYHVYRLRVIDSGAMVKLWADGEVIASSAGVQTLGAFTFDKFRVGTSIHNSNAFGGEIAFIGRSKSVTTDAEAQAMDKALLAMLRSDRVVIDTAISTGHKDQSAGKFVALDTSNMKVTLDPDTAVITSIFDTTGDATTNVGNVQGIHIAVNGEQVLVGDSGMAIDAPSRNLYEPTARPWVWEYKTITATASGTESSFPNTPELIAEIQGWEAEGGRNAFYDDGSAIAPAAYAVDRLGLGIQLYNATSNPVAASVMEMTYKRRVPI